MILDCRRSFWKRKECQITFPEMYLSPAQLDALRNYKYAAGLYGFLDTLMTPFWNWSVTLLPMSLAPNMVTLIALMCMMSGSALVLFLNPSLSQPMPSWALLYCCLCLFLYQTLDAIDGKQARRTGSSSPLGQLFDHGCDSVNVTLLLVITSGCLHVGDDAFLLCGLFVIFTLPFYMANWEEFQTGCMRFGILGVTEAQWVMMLITVVTAAFGGDIWTVSVLGCCVRKALIGIASAGSCLGVFEKFAGFFSTQQDATDFGISIYKVFWDKSTTLRANFSTKNAIAQMLQFGLFLVLTIAWMLAPHQKQIFQYPALPLIAAGLSFSYVINRLIVAHVTHCPEFSASFYIMPPLFFLTLVSWISSAPVFVMTLCIYLLYVIILYSHFAYHIIIEICECLQIRPFTITTKTD